MTEQPAVPETPAQLLVAHLADLTRIAQGRRRHNKPRRGKAKRAARVRASTALAALHPPAEVADVDLPPLWPGDLPYRGRSEVDGFGGARMPGTGYLEVWDLDGQPVPVANHDEWIAAMGRQEQARRSGAVVVGRSTFYRAGVRLWIATDWLGIDMNWGKTPPVLWETMVFINSHRSGTGARDAVEGGTWRYMSRRAAVEGHRLLASLIRQEQAARRTAWTQRPSRIREQARQQSLRAAKRTSRHLRGAAASAVR